MMIIANPTKPIIEYPCSDGERLEKPWAESYAHLWVIINTIAVLTEYLSGQQISVLGNQFLYYSQGYPKMRVAPDVMVIFNVAPSGRDNYKIWEEGEVPKVVFEMTSKSTRNQDQEFKKQLYEQLGVQEYWLFDPRGEWIPEQLRGFQLERDGYQPIDNCQSMALGLRIEVQGEAIAFYRLDNGEKLLNPAETTAALEQSQYLLEQSQARTERLAAKLRELGIDEE